MLSDPQFVEFLKNDVITSWETVREPVRVTLDMGDGRTMRRTIGGNTVMYVVAKTGGVVDAFPGVYLPKDVLPDMVAAVSMADQDPRFWREYHRVGATKSKLERLWISTSKTGVEAPILDGLKLPMPTVESRIVDDSHNPYTGAEVRQRLGVPSGMTSSEAGTLAVQRDSHNNREKLRPLVHEVMRRWWNNRPEDFTRTLFKDLLGVPLDDPDLGLTSVVTPGTPGAMRVGR